MPIVNLGLGTWIDDTTGQIVAYDPNISGLASGQFGGSQAWDPGSYAMSGLSTVPPVPVAPPPPVINKAVLAPVLTPTPQLTLGTGGTPGGNMQIPISSLAKWLPLLLAAIPQLKSWLTNAKPGDTIPVDSLPSWFKDFLAVAGLAIAGVAGYQLVHDLFGKNGSGSGVVPTGFTPAWKAGSTQFYRGPGRKLGSMSQKGRWREWTPKRPVAVLYANGAPNLRAFIRGGEALMKQAKRFKTVAEHMAGGERKVTRGQARKELIEEAQTRRIIEAGK